MTTKLLTESQWKECRLPAYYIKAYNVMWTVGQQDIIKSWLESHCGSNWVYWDGDKTYFFGSLGDRLLFEMWIKSDPFTDDIET